jgi:hypothetical protein
MKSKTKAAGVSFTADAIPVSTPRGQRGELTRQSAATSAISATLTCPYSSVLRTGSSSNAAGSTQATVRHRVSHGVGNGVGHPVGHGAPSVGAAALGPCPACARARARRPWSAESRKIRSTSAVSVIVASVSTATAARIGISASGDSSTAAIGG